MNSKLIRQEKTNDQKQKGYRTMKTKRIAGLLVAGCFGLIAAAPVVWAQDADNPPKVPKVEERIARQLERMTVRLELSERQKTDIEAVMKTNLTELEAVMEKMKSLHDKMEKDVDALLTEEQLAKKPNFQRGPRGPFADDRPDAGIGRGGRGGRGPGADAPAGIGRGGRGGRGPGADAPAGVGRGGRGGRGPGADAPAGIGRGGRGGRGLNADAPAGIGRGGRGGRGLNADAPAGVGRGGRGGRGLGADAGFGPNVEGLRGALRQLNLTDEQKAKLEELCNAENCPFGMQGPRLNRGGRNMERPETPRAGIGRGFRGILRDLDLTNEQRTQIHKIMQDRPEKPIEAVKEVLTDEQLKKLEELQVENPKDRPFKDQRRNRNIERPRRGDF